ncbi:putative glycosyltransferase CsbB [Methanobrevibacter oralis]|uniref:Glycosyltransferase CsbB n=1 Tax=Methanobrevibacter oralis TaxID=66851 RepID=A0A162FI31_METOA|nr:glycosyltransferase family 2 protein [Methanobrevibacter oralis]KZX13355.1 putative glycosyltransferase CsbB [Methanobrevibacter oralis]
MFFISVIVPCFNEENAIFDFYEETTHILDNFSNNEINYEFIFVDDGSSDNTLSNIKTLSKQDNNVKFISFSRNFGKESALYAGLVNSSGDYVVIMDVDLQDPPSLLPEMISILEDSDFDCVATRRVSRKGEPIIRSFFARLFYKLMSFSDVDLVDGARDYRMMKRQVVNSVLELNEYNRFSKGIFQWVGFKNKWLEYENIERINGETSWSFWSLFKYSIEAIVAFTTLPLSISTFMGILCSIISFILIGVVVFKNLVFGDAVQGWTSLICVILLLGGIQLLSIGILGKYLEKTYIETKKRPIYLVKETNFKI